MPSKRGGCEEHSADYRRLLAEALAEGASHLKAEV